VKPEREGKKLKLDKKGILFEITNRRQEKEKKFP